jgi:PD-(D/E)XK endonuclease
MVPVPSVPHFRTRSQRAPKKASKDEPPLVSNNLVNSKLEQNPATQERQEAQHPVIPTGAQRQQAQWRDLLFASSRPRLVRVQVKSSTQMLEGFYRVNAHRRINGRAVPYTLAEIDFFAAYIIPEDSWFIFPLPHILGQTALLLNPKRRRKPHLTDPYREAWHYLYQSDGLEFA